MAALALADVLVDFGLRQMRASDTVPQLVPHQPVQPSVGALVAAEVARAETALEERLRLGHAAELEAERERHQAEIDTLQMRLGIEAGEAIASACAALEERVSAAVIGPVARILSRLMTQDLSRNSVAALQGLIVEAMRDGEAVRLTVSGPAALRDGVAEAVGARAATVDFRELDGFDLSASVNGALLETRIGEWSSTLAEIMP